jgi:hypothetical protein
MPHKLPTTPIRPVSKPVKNKAYLGWIHDLPCIVTGAEGVQAAHLSTPNLAWGHLGRGMSQKASDRWVLPLSPEMHDEQHSMNEMEFWRKKEINPYPCALALYGLFADNDLEAARFFCRNVRFGMYHGL